MLFWLGMDIPFCSQHKKRNGEKEERHCGGGGPEGWNVGNEFLGKSRLGNRWRGIVAISVVEVVVVARLSHPTGQNPASWEVRLFGWSRAEDNLPIPLCRACVVPASIQDEEFRDEARVFLAPSTTTISTMPRTNTLSDGCETWGLESGLKDKHCLAQDPSALGQGSDRKC